MADMSPNQMCVCVCVCVCYNFVYLLTKVYTELGLALLGLPYWLGLENAPNASLQRGEIPPHECPEMTLNNLMVRFQ